MIIVFGAGHVDGAKTYMGYTEDAAMLDLAQRKAVYARLYGQTTHVMNVRAIASYQGIQDFVHDVAAELASLEHSNADDSINEEPNEPNRVVVYRTVVNSGDGPCRAIGQACADILQTTLAPIQHRANSYGFDYYGAIKRAMQGGCKDAFLIEHGFHTHAATRAKLSDPAIRQQLAEKEVDAMAGYYGWIKVASSGGGEDMLQRGDKGTSVTYWQKSLLTWNPSALPTWGADSDFGAETETWTKNYQKAVGLPETGIVNTVTFAAMLNSLQSVTAAVNIKLGDAQRDLAKASNLLLIEKEAGKIAQGLYDGLRTTYNNLVKAKDTVAKAQII